VWQLNLLISIGWCCILALSALGTGACVNPKGSPLHPILDLSLGVAIQGSLTTWGLMLGIFDPVYMGLILILGVLGNYFLLRENRVFWRIFPRPKFNFSLAYSSLIAVFMAAGFLRMLTPSGGQESFQYHYYLPQLFCEQQTIFVQGFELYEALLNVWGFESLLAMSQLFGGLPFASLHVWFLYVLFVGQIYLAALWLTDNRTVAWLASLLALFCSVYSCFLWWTKPELPLAGFLALLVAYWMRHNNLLNATKRDAVISGLISAWLLSLKITGVVLLPIFLIFIFTSGRLKWRWLAIYFATMAVCFLPWIIFLSQSHGGLGAFPMDNPRNFEAPSALPLQLPYSLWSKYWRDLLFYIKIYQPASYIFILGLPYLVINYRRYWILLLGVVGNLAMAALLLKPETPFADEFRYVGFTLFVIPIGAAVILERFIFWRKEMKWLVLLVMVFFTYRRVEVSVAETWRHSGAYFKGQQTLAQALTREGSQQYEIYLRLRKDSSEKLLHVGHGNVAVNGPEVVHVGSWSKRYPLWKFQEPEDLWRWCRAHQIGWILFERWRYQTYARGFGGPEYVDSGLTAYYRETLRLMDSLKSDEVEGSTAQYALIRVPAQQP
jgi:hypothetical protein